MDISILQGAGLTKAEAEIYLTLLELGSSLAGRIAQKSGIHRRSVYDALERLIEKGLVSYIKTNNRKYFEAVEPKRLMQILEEKKQNLREHMNELELKFNLTKEKKETVFYKGKQALKSLFDDQIETGKTINVFGASVFAPEILKYYFPHYDNRRKSNKIKVKIIFDETARSRYRNYIKNIPLSDIKFLPKKYSSPAATNIYGDKVSIVLWTEEPVAVLIKNKEIADGYRNYFNLMWDIAKR